MVLYQFSRLMSAGDSNRGMKAAKTVNPNILKQSKETPVQVKQTVQHLPSDEIHKYNFPSITKAKMMEHHFRTKQNFFRPHSQVKNILQEAAMNELILHVLEK